MYMITDEYPGCKAFEPSEDCSYTCRYCGYDDLQHQYGKQIACEGFMDDETLHEAAEFMTTTHFHDYGCLEMQESELLNHQPDEFYRMCKGEHHATWYAWRHQYAVNQL